MCLELLEKHIADHVIDIGSGSGILSAAAWLLGAHYIAAVDICENAVRVTEDTLRQNAVRNYTLHCGNLITDAALREEVTRKLADVVVANITADVIVAMAGFLPQFHAETFIFSGIIDHRLPEVLAALEPHFTITETRKCEDWVALVCSRK
jgi:ribosomal protein L11 methyltransferase